MEKYIIIGIIVGTIIAAIKLYLYFVKGYDTTKSGLNAFSPLAIILGILYGFFGDK